MKTIRAIIVTSLQRWIDRGEGENACRQVKLVREIEGNPVLQRIDSWATPKGINIAQLATDIEEVARNDAQNANRGGIVEVYAIVPYYGVELSEGALCRFRINTVTSDETDGESTGVGQYTEGANDRGQRHQGMRHIEGMARIYVDATSRVFATLETMNQQLMADNRAMSAQLSSQRIELEESRDRSLERQLLAFRASEEEKRNTKMIEGLLTFGPGLLNMALGRPILPEDTTEQGTMMIKNWLKSLSVTQMEALQKNLDQMQFMPLLLMKQQVEQEAEQEEERKKKEAEREVMGSTRDPVVVEAIAKRDAAGVPRPPLAGDL